MRCVLLSLLGVAVGAAELSDQPVAIGAGARALGMGGAFSAVADDASAVTWNPAGLVQCERPEFALSTGGGYNWIGGASSHDESPSSPDLEHVSVLLPFFAGGCMQTIGVAWQRQYDYAREKTWDRSVVLDFDDPPAGDFVLLTHDHDEYHRSGSLATLGASYAIEPVSGLALGLTVNLWADRWTGASSYIAESQQVSREQMFIFGVPDLPTDTVGQRTERNTVRRGTSVVLGVWWQAASGLTLAFVAKPRHRLGFDNSVRTKVITTIGTDPPVVTSPGWDDAVTLQMPTTLTVGSAWRPDDTHTLTADATWTRWREYRSEGRIWGLRSPVNFYVPPDRFADLWTLRAGYEQIVILPRVVLVPRAGLLAEWLPVATAAASLDSIDTENVSASRDLWLGATAGLGLCQRHLIWDAAVQLRHGNNVGAAQYALPDRTADVTILTARLGLTVQF
jgi:hypothetical protein